MIAPNLRGHMRRMENTGPDSFRGRQQDHTEGAASHLPCPRGNQTHHSRTLVALQTLPSRTRIRKQCEAVPKDATRMADC